ncbi:MAG: hypothetical protein IPF72_19425 [Chitinophagaceae bacterium]|nr:hypothetical protein [Chitinophagaceae bacterium]
MATLLGIECPVCGLNAISLHLASRDLPWKVINQPLCCADHMECFQNFQKSMGRRRLLLEVPMRALALLLPCFLALPVGAQKAKPTPAKTEPAKDAKGARVDWDGEWTLHASQSDKLDEQIETHLKDLNFGLRLLWKKKLQSACRSFGQLDILAGGSFSVTLDKERSIDTPFDGTEEPWKRSDGETFKASLSGQGRPWSRPSRARATC